MCLLLHPGFIATMHRTRLWRNDGAVSRVQSTDCHHSSLRLDLTLVHCYFTGQFVQDQDGNPTAAPSRCVMLSGRGAQSPPSHAGHARGDFLAGLGACIGAVQSVYLHGLLATVNEGSSPGR